MEFDAGYLKEEALLREFDGYDQWEIAELPIREVGEPTWKEVKDKIMARRREAVRPAFNINEIQFRIRCITSLKKIIKKLVVFSQNFLELTKLAILWRSFSNEERKVCHIIMMI